jgi:hypothetical protein
MSDQESDTTSQKPKPLSTTQTTTAFSTPLSWSDSHKAHSQHQQSHLGLERHAGIVASLPTSRPAFPTTNAFSVPMGFNDSQRAHLHEQKIHQTAEEKAQPQATTTSFSSSLGYNDSEQAHMHQQKIYESEPGKSASPTMIEPLRTNPKFEDVRRRVYQRSDEICQFIDDRDANFQNQADSPVEKFRKLSGARDRARGWIRSMSGPLEETSTQASME